MKNIKTIYTLVMLLMTSLSSTAVTLNVNVPEGTSRCYVAGDFQGWNASNPVEMRSTGTNTFSVTLDGVDNAAIAKGYKYLCGKSWDYVEKDASGNEIGNRTTPGNPDVVASWYHVNNANVEEFTITLNGYPRKVRVVVPDNYDSNNEKYPVTYLTGVQQRFSMAGDDSDRGDDFFGFYSWNLPANLKESRAWNVNPNILVSVYGFYSECMPYKNEEYIGSGATEGFLKDFVNVLMPEINKRYRTLTGNYHTTIVGADVGAMLSLYAASKYPTVFGTCVAISPLTMLNHDEMIGTLSTVEKSGPFYVIAVGSKEPQSVKDECESISATLKSKGVLVSDIVLEGGIHTDDSWGANFKYIYNEYADANGGKAKAQSTSPYQLWNYVSSSLSADDTAPFVNATYHKKDGSNVEAWISTKTIPTSVKSTYYWNVKDLANDKFLFSSNKTVGFSSKKSSDSWHRIVVLGDGSVEDIAASSTAFKLESAGGSVTMSKTTDYTVTADVTLSSAEKWVKVRYGSVNSGSDMGVCSPTVTLPSDCAKATVSYNFATNELTYTATEGGQGPDEPEPDPENPEYTLYNGHGTPALTADDSVKFSDITFHTKAGGTTPVKAMIKEIPASEKTTYYWNVGYDTPSGTKYLKTSAGNITFSSSKSATSWHRVVINESKSLEDIAASSAAFRMVTKDATTTMSVAGQYKVKASATFDTSDKSISIHYGSVNSGSDMGACSATVYASAKCLEAEVTYDFLTNEVSIVETSTGDPIEGVVVESMQSIPAITRPGESAKIKIAFANAAGCTPTLTYDYNYGTATALTLNKVADNAWEANLSNLKAGIYNLSLSVNKNGTTKSNVAHTSIKVVDGELSKQKDVTLNAYEDVDWNSYGQYKGNFHTHTSQSFDTEFRVDQVVDRYHNANYDILALTDHDANPYPWTLFDVFNPEGKSRDPQSMGMLAIPGNELSKDDTNSWHESSGGEYNHHNDFFTGRRGQEFHTLRESYAYTHALGGMQLINHPGQYWSLSATYADGEKNSPSWHAENFRMYPSLIGLEVYNQGNRRPNDRILWDQILDINMPERPVWGYSNDDTHTAEQYFRNYQYMLMPSLSVDELKIAMAGGHTYFSYEYTGSGEAKAPHISSINVDKTAHTITVETSDGDNIQWLSGTDRQGDNSTRRSTVVAVGKTFDYTNYQGKYVRALITNNYGETCTQPFGFAFVDPDSGKELLSSETKTMAVFPCPAVDMVNVVVRGGLTLGEIRIYDLSGNQVMSHDAGEETSIKLSVGHLQRGIYVVEASGSTAKLIKE